MSPASTSSRHHTLALILLALCALLGLGHLAMAAWMERPIPDDLLEAGARTDVARPFLLVVIDGLHEEAWNNPEAMPKLRALAREGVSGIAMTGEPTLTAACVRAIVSGRRPDVITAFKNFNADPVPGNLIGFLVDRGGIAAHAGDAAVYQLCKPAFEAAKATGAPGARVFQVRDQGPTDQGQTDARAVPHALESIDLGANVVSLHLTKVDHSGHKYGATGHEYLHACTVVDGQIAQVVERFRGKFPAATILVASDHGVSARGTHGGGELSARRAPFVIVGPEIERIADAEIDQSSLAPTVAMALGLPIPPLADAPPLPEFTSLPTSEEHDAMLAYIKVRVHLASKRGSGLEDKIKRINAQVALENLRSDDAWMALAEEANALVAPNAATAALFALLLAWFCIVCIMHFARAPPVAPPVAWVLHVVFGVGCLATIYVFSTWVELTPWHMGFLAAFVCAVAVLVVGTRSFRWLGAGACLASIPVLTRAGKAFQDGFTEHTTALGATSRMWLVIAVFAVILGVFFRPHALVIRLRRRMRGDAVAMVAIFGAAIGFGLTLRPFVDNVIHTVVLYALAAGCAVLAIARSEGARAAPRWVRIAFLAVAALLIGGSRIAEGIVGQEWVNVASIRDPLWLALGFVSTAATLAVMPRAAWGGACRTSLGLAAVGWIGAVGFRILGGDALEAMWGRTGVVTYFFCVAGCGLASVAVTANRGSREGRLLVRILGALALARLLSVLDVEYALFALAAVGAVLAARFRAPQTRFGLARLALGLILLRQGIFHAMGFVDSFSTLDVAQGFAGLGTAQDPTELGPDAAQISWQVQVAGLLVTLRMALPWILIFAALLHAAGARARGTLRQVARDLAVGFGARGAVLVPAVWVWSENHWWMGLAHTVYAYAAADLLLVLAMAMLVGAWRRAGRDAPLPAGGVTAKMPA